MSKINPLAGPLDAGALIAVGGYIIAVAVNDKIKDFASEAKQDAVPFLEMVAALYILIALAKFGGPFGQIMSALVTISIIGLGIKAASSGSSTLESFRSGQTGLFETIINLAKR